MGNLDFRRLSIADKISFGKKFAENLKEFSGHEILGNRLTVIESSVTTLAEINQSTLSLEAKKLDATALRDQRDSEADAEVRITRHMVLSVIKESSPEFKHLFMDGGVWFLSAQISTQLVGMEYLERGLNRYIQWPFSLERKNAVNQRRIALQDAERQLVAITNEYKNKMQEKIEADKNFDLEIARTIRFVEGVFIDNPQKISSIIPAVPSKKKAGTTEETSNNN